jgi:hypothetical protein
MRISRDKTTTADILGEVKVTRFLWDFAKSWQQAKKAGGLDEFWLGTQVLLIRFDEENPDGHRILPPAPAPLPADQSRILAPTLPPQPPQKPTKTTPRKIFTPAPTDRTKTKTAPAPAPVNDKGRIIKPSPQVYSRKPYRLTWKPRLPLKEATPPESNDRPLPAIKVKVRPAPAPVQKDSEPETTSNESGYETKEARRKEKGKMKMVEESSDSHSDYETTEKKRKQWKKNSTRDEESSNDDSSEEESEEEKSLEKVKKEGKMKRKDKDEAGDEVGGRIRKIPKATGKRRKTTCARCVRIKAECLEQEGGKACINCATVKMKCIDEEDTSKGKNTKIRPAPAKPPPASSSGNRPASPATSRSKSKQPQKKSSSINKGLIRFSFFF